MAGLVGRFIGDRSGNMSLLFAGAMTLAAGLGAFAIDEASLFQQRRAAQSGADLAAMAAAARPADALALARASLEAAGLIEAGVPLAQLTDIGQPTHLVVETGRYSPDPGLAPEARFSPGGAGANAVRIRLVTTGRLYFAAAWMTPPAIAVEAVAATTPQVAFSVGSRLAALKDGMANAVLNGLLGTNVSLGAVSYNGLLQADIGLFAFLDALAGELHLSAATYADVLAASADHGAIARAMAKLLTGAERSAALVIANAAGHNGKVPLAKLFDLGPYAHLAVGSGPADPLVKLSALQLLAASAGLSDGSHQVTLNLGASVPGLTSIAATLVVGEPAQGRAWYGLGPSGTLVRTAQVRLRLVANLLGGPLLLGTGVRLPIYLDLASAEAGVRSAACPQSGAPYGSAVIATTPGIARLMLGEVSDGALADTSKAPTVTTATLINVLGLLQVRGRTDIAMAQTTPIPLSFSSADIQAGRVRTARTTTYTQSLVGSLLENTQLTITTGLGVAGAPTIQRALGALLDPVLPVLDSVIAGLLEPLGLSLGEADVQVYGVRCSQAVLVG